MKQNCYKNIYKKGHAATKKHLIFIKNGQKKYKEMYAKSSLSKHQSMLLQITNIQKGNFTKGRVFDVWCYCF
jgi:hypothetical protein